MTDLNKELYISNTENVKESEMDKNINIDTSFNTPSNDDTYYFIVNLNSGKCLDVLNSSKSDGARIIQNQMDINKPSQHWKMERSVGTLGFWYFTNKNSGKYLTINGYFPFIGWALTQNSNQAIIGSDPKQIYALINPKSEYYSIRPAANLVSAVDVSNSSKDDGASIILWFPKVTEMDNQYFKFQQIN